MKTLDFSLPLRGLHACPLLSPILTRSKLTISVIRQRASAVRVFRATGALAIDQLRLHLDEAALVEARLKAHLHCRVDTAIRFRRQLALLEIGLAVHGLFG